MNEKNAAKSYLVRLMLHIIKWFSQPERRSKSWERSIKDSQKKLEEIQKSNSSINKNFFALWWNKIFNKAQKEAEKEMGKPSEIESLNEKQVFEDDYTLEGDENPQAQEPRKRKKRRRKE